MYEQVKCFFCGRDVALRRSPLDLLGQPPDLWEICCDNENCRLDYHCEGTLLAAPPDLALCAETKERVRAANKSGVRIVFACTSSGLHIQEISPE